MNKKLPVFADQALSSATNFGASALVAGLLTAPDFGAYALAFTFYLIALGLSRSWTSDPLLVLWSASSDRALSERAVARAALVAAALGAAFALVAMVIGLVVRGSSGEAMLVLAVLLPFALVQDVWRFGLVMLERPWGACVSDLIWLVVAIGSIMSLRLADNRSLPLAMAAWMVGAVPGALIGFRQVSSTWHRPRVIRWLSEVGGLSRSISAEFMVLTVSGYLMVVVLAGLGSLDDAAAVRAAQIIMGPVTVVFAGAAMYVIPEMARASLGGGRRTYRIGQIQSVLLAALAAGWLLAALLIPDFIGERVFGASWAGASDVLFVVGLAYVGNAATTGAVSGLRAMGWARLSLRLRLVAAALIIAGTAAGSFHSIPEGALAGFAAGSCLAVATWWAGFRSRYRERLIAAIEGAL